MNNFLLAFIPLFVTVDAIGTLPIFVALTEGVDAARKRVIIFQSIITALCLALGFIWLGKKTFHVLGITVGDFMVAGGGILFCIAIIDLLQPGQQRRVPPEDLGAVPIGTPLIVGPAVLTTSLMLVDQFGWPATAAAVSVNIILAGVVFLCSDLLIKIIGRAGSRALSKVMALLLAAIAVMMVRKGIFLIIGH